MEQQTEKWIFPDSHFCPITTPSEKEIRRDEAVFREERQ